MKTDTSRQAGRLAFWRDVMVSSPAATPRGEPGVNYIQPGLCTIKTRLAASCLPQFPSVLITSLDAGTCSRKKNPPKKRQESEISRRRGQTDDQRGR